MSEIDFFHGILFLGEIYHVQGNVTSEVFSKIDWQPRYYVIHREATVAGADIQDGFTLIAPLSVTEKVIQNENIVIFL